MKMIEMKGDEVTLTIKRDELSILEQCLSEVLHTIDLDETDCQARLNCSRTQAETLIEELTKLLGD